MWNLIEETMYNNNYFYSLFKHNSSNFQDNLTLCTKHFVWLQEKMIIKLKKIANW